MAISVTVYFESVVCVVRASGLSGKSISGHVSELCAFCRIWKYGLTVMPFTVEAYSLFVIVMLILFGGIAWSENSGVDDALLVLIKKKQEAKTDRISNAATVLQDCDFTFCLSKSAMFNGAFLG